MAIESQSVMDAADKYLLVRLATACIVGNFGKVLKVKLLAI